MDVGTLPTLPFGQFGPRFVLFAALFASSPVTVVLLVKRAPGGNDASRPCLLDGEYTEVTRTSAGLRIVSYRVGYTFVAAGDRYSGTDTIYQRPTGREATLRHMAANPRDNALRPNRLNRSAPIAAPVAFLIALIAYWRLRTHYLIATANRRAAPRQALGIWEAST